MVSRVKADVESLEHHVQYIKNRCESMLEDSYKFSTDASATSWKDNNSELVLDVYGGVARSLESIIQIMDGASEILNKQVGCLKDYYNVVI